MRALLITTAVAAVAAATPAAAQPSSMTVEGRADQFTEVVHAGDLNLASDGAILRQRVLAASGRVCARAFRDENAAGKLVGACTDGTYRDAKPAINQMIAMVKSGRQLAATSIRIQLAMR